MTMSARRFAIVMLVVAMLATGWLFGRPALFRQDVAARRSVYSAVIPPASPACIVSSYLSK